MSSIEYLNDSFANLKTLLTNELCLLVRLMLIFMVFLFLAEIIFKMIYLQNDLIHAFKSQNLDEFKEILARTGLKTTNQDLINKKSRNFTTSRNILFERELESDESLFEIILKTPGHGRGRFISLIWSEGELWKNQEVLETVW